MENISEVKDMELSEFYCREHTEEFREAITDYVGDLERW